MFCFGRFYCVLCFQILANLFRFGAEAFIVQKSFGRHVTQRDTTNILPSLSKYSIGSSKSLSTFKPIEAHPDFLLSSSLLPDDLLETAKNALIAIGGAWVVYTVFMFVFFSVGVPTLANFYEKRAKEEDPELWREFERKLLPGESLAERPELMNELGMRLQGIIETRNEKMFEEMETLLSEESEDNEDETAPDARATSTSTASENEPNDVKVIPKNKWDD